MAGSALPSSAFGLTWALDTGRGLLTKSLAPSFVFVDYATFANTNVLHRLRKRQIDAYVTVMAPLGLLASLYGFQYAFELLSGPADSDAVKRSCDYVSASIQAASEGGADAVVICDDLCGSRMPLPDPIFVVESLMPLYRRFGQEAESLGIPLVLHSEGDIHEYYPAFSEAGYSGVHVAHPKFAQVQSLFGAAHEAGLVPLGGIVTEGILERTPEESAAMALELVGAGPALICDDGRIADPAVLSAVTSVLAICRKGGEAS